MAVQVENDTLAMMWFEFISFHFLIIIFKKKFIKL